MANAVINPKNRPFTVLIEGNIGCGKTTFLNHFKKYNNVCVLAEPINMWRNLKGHNLLDLMYKDTEKWSFPFQSYVMMTMLKNHTLETEHPVKLMERSIYSARYCFTEKLWRDGKMNNAEATVLNEWFDWIHDSVEVPADLIVYLRSSPEVVYRRMMIRNRSEEKCVPLEYLQDLHRYHEDWLYNRTSFNIAAPVVTLNADLDISVIQEEYEKYEPHIMNRISART